MRAVSIAPVTLDIQETVLLALILMSALQHPAVQMRCVLTMRADSLAPVTLDIQETVLLALI